MDITEITNKAVKEAGLEKISRKQKEAFLRQYYFDRDYYFMSHDEIISELKSEMLMDE